jgi:hypothetical protein
MYHHITHASPGKPAVASRECTYNSQKWVETQVKKKGMRWPLPVADESRDRRDGRLYIHMQSRRKSCVSDNKRCIARSLIFCFVCPLSLRHVMMTSQNTHDNTPLFSPLASWGSKPCSGTWNGGERGEWQAALPFSRVSGFRLAREHSLSSKSGIGLPSPFFSKQPEIDLPFGWCFWVGVLLVPRNMRA